MARGRRLIKEDRPQPFFFLISIAFCERFIFCILRGILALYIMEMLMYDERRTKIIYHTFVAALYIFPLFGTILVDTCLGKYRTILYSSVVCVVGNVLLTASAIKSLQFPEKSLGMMALILIIIGTGGIKSCFIAFCRDQFELPKQDNAMNAYFYFFYFIINMGSFIALLIAPLLRGRVSCLGQETCYPLAFLVPAVLMTLAIGVFRAGKPLYKKARPEGSMLVELVACIYTATRNKLAARGQCLQQEHWLDYALEEYEEEMVDDTKTVLPMFLVFLPLSIFWALYEQQATSWTFQARHLDGHLGNYITILPDQMQIVNPALVLIFIPIFQYIIYPALRSIKIIRKPLQRMVVGGIFAAIAFVFTSSLQYKIENVDINIAIPEGTMMHVFNLFYCDTILTNFYWEWEVWDVYPIKAMTVRSLKVRYFQSWWHPTDFYIVRLKSYCTKMSLEARLRVGDIPLVEKNNHMYCWNTEKTQDFHCRYLEITTKPTGKARIKLILVNFNDSRPVVYSFYDSSGYLYLEYLSSDVSFRDIAAGQYGIEFGCSMRYSVTFAIGGVYMVAICMEREDRFLVRNFEVFSPKSISMLTLLPQYVFMAVAEVMFTMSGLQFVHEEAPENMEALMHMVWLFSIGVGQLVVVAIEAIHFYEKYSSTYLLYAGVMVVDMIVFTIIVWCYEYQDSKKENCNIYKFTLIY